MFQPLLKNGRGVSHHAVERREGKMAPVQLLKPADPDARIREDVVVGRGAAGQREPLQIVGVENVLVEGKVDAGMGRGRGHDGYQVGWYFLGRGPLILARDRKSVV